MMSTPLDGITVVDFSQFLSGPSATLRLQDLGARVIKIENPNQGDLARSIYAKDFEVAGSSAFFQAINRGKESVCLDLKDKNQRPLLHAIIQKADVIIHNFRPEVMPRLGLDYDSVKQINSRIIYGHISGYGSEGPWKNKPGQDLLLQALSGLSSLSGQNSDGQIPVGVAVADLFAGAQLVQGVLAALVADRSTLIEVSMLEAILDFQFEPLTLYYQDQQTVDRGNQNAAHALVGAPYGLYKTKNGFIALAMGAISILGELLKCDPLLSYTDSSQWFAKRDEIKAILASHLQHQTSEYWLEILEAADIWCALVQDWQQLLAHDGFKVLQMLQTVSGKTGSYQTTRCPIRIDGQRLFNTTAAPKLGEHTASIQSEFSWVAK